MVRPMMERPCCWSKAATVEESTPPLMATATRPDWTSAHSGRLSNCVLVLMHVLFYGKTGHCAQAGPCDELRPRIGLVTIRGRQLAELFYGGGDHLQREIDFCDGGVAAQAEAQARSRFFRGKP